MIKCKSNDFEKIEKDDIIKYQKTENGYKVLINTQISSNKYENMLIDSVNIEDILLIYKKGEYI